MKKRSVYLAGPLFNEAEVQQRLLEGKLFRERFGDTLDLFNPIEQPFNENKQSLPTPEDIFWGDTGAVLDCTYFIADVTNNDPGVMVELGIAWANKKTIVAINSDIRLKSANKYKIPSYSLNHYVLGCIEDGGWLVKNYKEALDKIEKFEKGEWK